MKEGDAQVSEEIHWFFLCFEAVSLLKETNIHNIFDGQVEEDEGIATQFKLGREGDTPHVHISCQNVPNYRIGGLSNTPRPGRS